MKKERLLALLLMTATLQGCESLNGSRIQSRAFRDYLNFNDICLYEQHREPAYCATLWKQYTDGRATVVAGQHKLVVDVSADGQIISRDGLPGPSYDEMIHQDLIDALSSRGGY